MGSGEAFKVKTSELVKKRPQNGQKSQKPRGNEILLKKKNKTKKIWWSTLLKYII